MATTKDPWVEWRARSTRARKALTTLLADAEKLLSADAVDAIAASGALASEREGWLGHLRQVADELGSRTGSIESLASEQAENFVSRLTRMMTEQGQTVDGAGQTLFVGGTVEVHCDVARLRVRINGAPSGSTDVMLLADEISLAVEALKKEETDPKTMLAQLLDAYRAVLATTGKGTGAQVQTVEIIYQMALLRQSPRFRTNPTSGTFRGYGQVHFRHDLFRLLEAGEIEIEGLRFRHASGSDKKGALFMLVPSLGRTSHVGRMWFEEKAKA